MQDLEIEVWETWSKEAGRFVYDYTVDEDCYIDKGKIVLTVAGELIELWLFRGLGFTLSDRLTAVCWML